MRIRRLGTNPLRLRITFDGTNVIVSNERIDLHTFMTLSSHLNDGTPCPRNCKRRTACEHCTLSSRNTDTGEAPTNEERCRQFANELERNRLFRIFEALMAQPDDTYFSHGRLLEIFCADEELGAGIPFKSDAASLNLMNPYPAKFFNALRGGIVFLSDEEIDDNLT